MKNKIYLILLILFVFLVSSLNVFGEESIKKYCYTQGSICSRHDICPWLYPVRCENENPQNIVEQGKICMPILSTWCQMWDNGLWCFDPQSGTFQLKYPGSGTGNGHLSTSVGYCCGDCPPFVKDISLFPQDPDLESEIIYKNSEGLPYENADLNCTAILSYILDISTISADYKLTISSNIHDSKELTGTLSCNRNDREDCSISLLIENKDTVAGDKIKCSITPKVESKIGETKNIEITVAPDLDLSLVNIKPVQVIEDVPLIEGKETMVRVFPYFDSEIGNNIVKDVRLSLVFDDKEYQSQGTLVKYKDKIFVLREDEAESFYSGLYSSSATEKQKEDLVKWAIYNGKESYNIYVSAPTNGGRKIEMYAEIDPGYEPSEQFRRDKLEEINEWNNFYPKKVYDNNNQLIDNWEMRIKLTEPDGDLTYVYRPLAVGTWQNKVEGEHIEISDFCNNNDDFLEAIWPLSGNRILSKCDEDALHLLKLDIDITEKISVATLLFQLANYKRLEQEYKDKDVLVIVLPSDYYQKLVGATHPWVKSVVLVEYNPNLYFAVAHEIIHSYLGFVDEGSVKKGRPDFNPYGNPAADGWWVNYKYPMISLNKENNKGGAFGETCDNPLYFDMQHNYYCVMGWSAVAVEDYCGYKDKEKIIPKWIDRKHYLDLMKIFADTPEDPKLLFVNGLMYEDGEILMLPWFYTEGTPDEFYNVENSDYSFELLSENGEILHKIELPDPLFWFNTTESRRFELFSFGMVYPENTAKIVFKHKDEILKEVKPSKYPPVIKIKPVTKKGTNSHIVRWNVEDKDDNEDDINYVMLYSKDKIKWYPLTSYLGVYIKHPSEGNVAVGEFEFDTTNFKEGTYYIKIIAIDKGFNIVEVVSDQFEIKKSVLTRGILLFIIQMKEILSKIITKIKNGGKNE